MCIKVVAERAPGSEACSGRRCQLPLAAAAVLCRLPQVVVPSEQAGTNECVQGSGPQHRTMCFAPPQVPAPTFKICGFLILFFHTPWQTHTHTQTDDTPVQHHELAVWPHHHRLGTMDLPVEEAHC